jgi:hypothetical protein
MAEDTRYIDSEVENLVASQRDPPPESTSTGFARALTENNSLLDPLVDKRIQEARRFSVERGDQTMWKYQRMR